MFEDCVPDLVLLHISQIDWQTLCESGIEFLIIDVDNTIALRKSIEVSITITDAFKSAKARGIKKICLLSNVGLASTKRKRRINQIATIVEADDFVCAYWPRIKPRAEPFLEAINRMPGATTKNTAMIGDQLLSDIKGGNRLGLFTIKVEPLGNDHWITFWKRILEKIIKKHLKI